MLKVVLEEMGPGEYGAVYQEGGDAVVIVASGLPEEAQFATLARLLGRLDVTVSCRPARLAAQPRGTARA